MLGRAAAADLYPPVLRGRGVGTVATAGAIGAVVGPLIAIAAGGGASALGIVRSAGPFLAVPVLGVVGALADQDAAAGSARVASDLRRWYRGLPPIPEPPPPRPRARADAARPGACGDHRDRARAGRMVGVMSITAVELGDHGWADWQVQLLMAAHFVGMFALAYPVGCSPTGSAAGARACSRSASAPSARSARRHGRLAADHAVLLPARPRLGGLLRVRHVRARGHHVAARARRADRQQRLRGRRVAAVSSLSAALLSGAGYWAVGWSSARSCWSRCRAAAPAGADRRRLRGGAAHGARGHRHALIPPAALHLGRRLATWPSAGRAVGRTGEAPASATPARPRSQTAPSRPGTRARP